MSSCVNLRRPHWNLQQLRCSNAGERSPSFMASYSDVLPWNTRWRIAVGAARGLQYLHDDSQVRSIMPHNSITQRNSDVSMTRSNSSMGTSCFSASENADSDSVTDKADIYTFGVMLLELITGRKAVDTTRARGPLTLMEWAQPLIHAGNTMELVDPRLNDMYDAHQLDKMIDAAGRCIDVAQLPTMSQVLQILERKLPTRVQPSAQPQIQPVPRDSTLLPGRSASPVTQAVVRPKLKLTYDMML